MISIVDPPDEPFPVIEQCQQSDEGHTHGQICTLFTSSTLNMTCTIRHYYPNATLFFHHNRNIVKPLQQREWNEGDGTKSRRVTIKATSSNYPYICIASSIPGAPPGESNRYEIVRVIALNGDTVVSDVFLPQHTTLSPKVRKGVYGEFIIVSSMQVIKGLTMRTIH